MKLLFSAGEASGDRHGAAVLAALKQKMPEIQALAMGGPALKAAGARMVVDSTELGVIGLFEVIRHYPKIRRALNIMKETLVKERPDLLICVDYKEFNFRLAKYAKHLGIKVLFYVSPQVWAWRPGRVKQYGRVISAMAVIFPFETAYYQAEGIPVRYVGHPLLDQRQAPRQRAEARTALALTEAEGPVIGLLPGSRIQEIERLLPVMLAAVSLLQQRYPKARFVWLAAERLSANEIQQRLGGRSIRVCQQPIEQVAPACDVVMATSGTATLETALLTVPMVIVYKLYPLTYWLARRVVKTKFIGLPNIIAGRGVVRELIQQQANAANLAAEMVRLLDDADYRQRQISALQQVKQTLGSGGAAENMAEFIVDLTCQPQETLQK
ncbi:MAG: lipid-A-disaccharide synthase [Methylococcales bacterium]|nr:lipid-A-disaccharide synthase [Methylococcales bacterium]